MSILLLEQIMELLLMMLMGYALVKAKKIKPQDSKGLSIVVIYLIMPCVILNAFQVEFNNQKIQGLILALVAAVISHIILLCITYLISSILKLSEVERASIIYSNAGNLIVPIIISVLGEEWVLYSSAFISVQLILI